MANTTITPNVGTLATIGLGLSMATLAYTSLAWPGLAQNAIGATPPNLALWSKTNMTVSGTLGAGGGIVIQGSNDAINWTPLATVSDLVAPGAVNYSSRLGGLTIKPLGNGLVNFSVTDWYDGFRYLRPVVSGGDGTTSISVTAQVAANGASF